VWAALLNVGGWFIHDAAHPAKQKLELRPGGKWISESADRTATQMMTVVYCEPGKLLRLCGQMGVTHLPVTTVIIFELQP